MVKTMRKITTFAFSLLCVLLGAWFAVSTALHVIALAQNSVVYVSDIKLWCGSNSGSEAKQYFDSIGYTMLNADLNLGTDTGEYVFLGYKTTENANDAITDIRMLPMDTGYQLYDYNEINEYLVSQNQGTARKLASTAATFADYYDEGSPKALKAYETLNLFDVRDKESGDNTNFEQYNILGYRVDLTGFGNENTRLGDYILENRDDLQEFFVKMIINCSAAVVGCVTNLLSYGVAPYENDYDPKTKTFYTSTWAERVADSAIWDQLSDGMTADEETALDRTYNDNAKILFRELQIFTTLYENAKVRYDEQAIREKEIFQDYETAAENMDDVTEEDADLLYLTAYDVLAGYAMNDGLNLAEWLLSIGRQTDETVDYRQLYPVVEALGDAQMDMVSLTNFLSAVNTLGSDEADDDFDDILESARAALAEYNDDNSQSLSIWKTAESDMKDKSYAYTSEAVRKSSAENLLGKKDYLEELEEDFSNVMGWIKLAVGIATTLVSAADVILKICACCSWASVAGTACAMKIIGWLTLGGFILSAAVMLVEFAYSIFCFFYELINGIDKTLHHTEKPAFVFDAVDTAKGSVTVRYQSVLDNKGAVGDLNAAKQYKWCLLAYTKDKNAGSPLCLDESGSVFRVVYGNSSNQNGYDHVRYYGERNVGNTNAYCEEDQQNGCYLHFRTVSSITGASRESDTEQQTVVDTETTSYIGGVTVGIAPTVDEAKAKIARHVGKYYTYDYNLSPDMDFATFIGYTITDDPSKAVTDIRIAPYAGSSDESVNMFIGDIKYTRAETVGVYVSNSDQQTKPQADALYYTTNENAGSPISVDGLHFITDFAEVEEGWEPVSLFCADLPYDFNTAYVTTNRAPLDTYSGYSPFSNKKTQSVYMYFEPTEKYVGGEQYLSGCYFIGGYSFVSTPKYTGEKVLDFNTLKDKIAAMPNTRICSTQFNYPIRKGAFTSPGTAEMQEYLVYTYTYNPKRAISDAVLYQGVTYVDSLPYNLSKPTDSGAAIGYTACSYIGQQLYDTFVLNGDMREYAATFIHKGNTFKDSAAMNILPERAASVRNFGFAEIWADNIDYGYKFSDYLPEGLFVARHVPGLEPLKLSDVVFGRKGYTGVEENGKIIYTLNGEDALDGKASEGYFHSVYEVKNPYSTRSFDLAYSRWYKTIENDPTQVLDRYESPYSLYIYLRGAKPSKPSYISGLTVGSSSREQYKKANPNITIKKEEELRGVDVIVDFSALNAALSSCSGEVVMVNACLNDQNDAWYSRQSSGKADRTPADNKPAAYIGVSRTTDPKKAITGVILYETDAFITAAEMSIGGVTYRCASTKNPIEMNGKNYFLYYTFNSGAVPGKPIEDIAIDNLPMIEGHATNLVYDGSQPQVYGDPNQANFIHLKYTKTTSDYYNKLYIGKGVNKNAAISDLLSQGCTDFVDIDLNEGVTGSSIYLGYRTKEIDWTEINKEKTDSKKTAAYNSQTKEAVYDIVLTRGEAFRPDGFVGTNGIYYYPVSSQDLNDGSGDPLYMYYACPFYSGRYNASHSDQTLLPQDVFSGFYRKLGFARYDRVPYNTSLEGESGSENSVMPWEYIMFSDSARSADFNSGAIQYNTDARYAEDIRITMFGQRTDGSVKPAGAITGGFLTDTMNVGSAIFTYN